MSADPPPETMFRGRSQDEIDAYNRWREAVKVLDAAQREECMSRAALMNIVGKSR